MLPTVLMTRHNLDSHLSWLLSRKVSPPSGAFARASAYSTRGEPVIADPAAEEADQEIPTASRSPSQRRRAAQVVNVVEAFARPALPASVTSKSQLQESRQVLSDEAMGKLSSATRSSRPGLMSQHQLATPASTTSSTAASYSSLNSNYVTFLKEGQDSPSSRPSANRTLPPKIQRSFQTQTPQTPRQTPRPTPGLKLDTIESVDLTNDDSGGTHAPGSSSSIETFGESTRLWREDSASRAEPLPRSSKKRKSIEMSPGRSKRTDSYERRHVRTARDQYKNTDGFVDIDDVVPSQSRQTPLRQSRTKAVKPSIELAMDRSDIEEVQVTETISRVETRTRKSLSRVSSVAEDLANQPHPGHSNTLSPSRRASPAMSPRPDIQVAASPFRRLKSPAASSLQTPPKNTQRRTRTTIQDSEDDDYNSDVDQRASCSPKVVTQTTPRVFGSLASPRLDSVPVFASNDHRVRDYRDSRPRTGSPLRPISQNFSVRPENVLSPFQQNSPTKTAFAKLVHPPSSQHTPGSSLGVDDRKIAMLYLTDPSEIELYHRRIQNLLAQNAVVSMSFVDSGEVAPSQLKSERKALLNMGKAYSSLLELEARWKLLMDEKKKLARQVYELLDRNSDTSPQEERQALVSQEIKSIEQQVVNCLHASGAIKDGFGTGSRQEANHQPEQTGGSEYAAPLPSASSTIGSTQIIMQTQFPQMIPSSITTSNAHFPKDVASQTTSKVHFAASSNVYLPPPSPSPVRRAVPAPSFTDSRLTTATKTRPSPEKFKQPNFYQEPPPLDYDDLDDEDFNELLEDEQKHQKHARTQDEVPDDIEDDYGDSGDDNDFMEMAQEVEKRQSLPSALPKQPKRLVSSDTVTTLPEPSRNPRAANETTMYSHVDDQSGKFDHQWSVDVKKALRERFKLKGFRLHQLDAINATLSGQDTFVLMPTGGGKSLCYQLPAVVNTGNTRGVTIVISPLLSLMNDQVQHLRAVNVQATSLNSDTPSDEKRQIYSFLREEHPEHYIQLLYITPEMVNKNQAMINVLGRLYSNKKLARIVIDEAHCVSQWGHDFRPDYVALGKVRTQFPTVPLMALTATATNNVKQDIMKNLNMRKCTPFVQSFNRPNLHYEVRLKKGKGILSKMVIEIADLVKKKYKNQTGIIYALSQRGCEELAEKLKSAHQIKAHHFHAGMTREEKETVLNDWQTGKIQLVVATIAFGMGIDKPDVRFVIHSSVPKSLEGYYQETGRAGRDGKKSGCYLYFGYQDISMLKSFIDKSEGNEEQKQRQRTMLQQMIQYCENRSDCRRSQVLAYFGEIFAKEKCRHTCDNCCSNAVFEIIDFTDYAKAAMRVITHVQSYSFTMLNCVEVLRGTPGATVKAKLAQMEDGGNFPEFGFASQVARGEIERLFYRLLLEKAITEVSIFNRSGFATDYVQLGPKCRDYVTGKEKVKLTVQVPGSTPAGKKSQSTAKLPTSTMLTSPIAAAPRRHKPDNRVSKETDYEQDGFVVSDDNEDYEDDAFESMPDTGSRGQKTFVNSFSGPITTDKRMAALNEIHRDVVLQFVQDAKSLEERLRNKAGARKPFFSEANFRDMAISFTVTLDAMRRIPDIKVDRVDAYGKPFIPLIKRYYDGYEELMAGNPEQDQDQDMDSNHQNVIDLVTDDEVDSEDDGEDDDEEDYGVDADTEAAMRVAERSPFFPEASNSFSRNGPAKSKSAGGAYRGRGRGRGGKKYKPRTSNGSASGQSTSGVSKRSWSGARKSRARKPSGLKFAQQGGRGGGGAGRGIGMMPTS